jgi:hypothetical protein
MTADFVAAVEKLAQDQRIPVVHFEKGSGRKPSPSLLQFRS